MLQSIYEYMIVLKTRELALSAAEVRRVPQPAVTAHADSRQSPPT
jgi:hypothetical protein